MRNHQIPSSQIYLPVTPYPPQDLPTHGLVCISNQLPQGQERAPHGSDERPSTPLLQFMMEAQWENK